MQIKKHPIRKKHGGRNRTRTCDPCDVNTVLYQLSYATFTETQSPYGWSISNGRVLGKYYLIGETIMINVSNNIYNSSEKKTSLSNKTITIDVLRKNKEAGYKKDGYVVLNRRLVNKMLTSFRSSMNEQITEMRNIINQLKHVN